GKCAEYCQYNAIFFLQEERVIQVMEDLCHGCGACFVACEYRAITPKESVLGTVNSFQITENTTLIEARMKVGVHSPVPVVKAAIKQAKPTDLVLMDAPPGTSCPFIQTVNLADYVILVTEPTPFGLSDLKQSVETLKSMGKRYGVIINRAGLGDEGVFNYLEQEKISLLMSIPFDREIASVYSTGKLLTNEFLEWKAKFRELFNIITAQYGNSSY
ncbi:MAG: 4Fe-4S binding protein, partial [Paludibacter sp.]|nr:4Fe-4S binding protein [Paludibacter sp.]